MTPEQLIEIGISKAMPLAQYTKRHAGKLPENLIESAINPKVGVEEFQSSLQESQYEKPEKGKWFQIPGFFVTPEEKEEIDRGLRTAEAVEPLPEDCPDWLKSKITVQRLVAEFLSTYPSTENGQWDAKAPSLRLILRLVRPWIIRELKQKHSARRTCFTARIWR